MSVPLHHPVDLLRFNTCGSVDDGKSTLIGRLLYDSKGVFEDQLEAAARSTVNRSAGPIDLSLLTVIIGHSIVAFPYVFLIVSARLVGLRARMR